MPSCCTTSRAIRHTRDGSLAGWFRGSGNGARAAAEPAAVDTPSATENHLHRFRIDPMLLDENALGESGRRIFVEHRDRSLEHDRAAIELAGDEMDGRAAHPDAMRERLRLRIHTGKCRKQRRVNVQ